jgi:hypothetical protein
VSTDIGQSETGGKLAWNKLNWFHRGDDRKVSTFSEYTIVRDGNTYWIYGDEGVDMARWSGLDQFEAICVVEELTKTKWN